MKKIQYFFVGLTIFSLTIISSYNYALSRPIISGISTNEIKIDTNFTGAEVLLFGAKGDAGNIIVVVRGPRENYLLSKKDHLFGIWYNKYLIKFKHTFGYYSFISSSKNTFIDPKTLSRLEIGKENIKFNIKENDEEQNKEFIREFINKLEKRNLYLSQPNSIEFLDDTLFKVILKFPKNIPTGIYTTEIYLMDENKVIAFQSIPINVHQIGLSAQINEFAYKSSIVYGITAILMAIIAGFMANFIFNRLFK